MLNNTLNRQFNTSNALAALLVLVCSLFVSSSLAQSSVAIFALPDDGLAQRTSQDVAQLLRDKNISVEPYSAIDALSDNLVENQTVLAIGNNACEQVAISTENRPVICGLISHYFQPGDIGRSNIEYMPLEVPAIYFMRLAQLLVPEVKTVGVLLGPQSHHRERYYRALAKTENLATEFSLLDMNSNPVTTMDPAMRKSQVYIALPDDVGFNRATAPWVLQLSLRYRMPLLAYSFNYANAGALASLYQSREDLANNLVKRLLNDSSPLEFSLRLNHAVAKNLGIALLSEDEYLLALQLGGR